MGACASFPKDLLEKKSSEAPAPEQPKEEVVATEGEKEIKVDDKAKEDEKTLGSLLKEEKSTEETKTIVTEEEKTVKTEEAVSEVKPEVESYVAPVAHLTSEDKKEIPEVKEEKK